MMPVSDVYDVIVIGAGAGGMTTAAVAAAEGLSVLVIEKTEFVGGTTAWSGGMVWIPANALMKQAGLPDSLVDAAGYLAGTVPETENADLREVFLSRGPEAVEYLEANTEVRLQPVKVYPDYYPDLPGATAGGRVLEPVTFDGAGLGTRFRRLRPPLPEFTLFGGMMVNRLDIPHLRKFGRSFRSTLRSLRLISQYAMQRLRAPRGTTLHLGNALAARLYASLLARNVEFRFGTSVEQLLIEGDAVRGVRVAGSSDGRSIAARKGVVLATGGFSHDAALRARFFPDAAGSVSAASPAGTGDGLRLAITGGATLGTRVADPAYWVPASLFRRSDGSQGVFPHTVTDRAKPGIIAVNAWGRRFVNEALSYHEFVRAMLADGNDTAGRSFYLVCDRHFLWTYGLGRIKPFTWRIRRYVRSGELIEAANIDALADSIGVERSALSETVGNYSMHARTGRDPEFGRGGTIYQRHLGDAGHSPNPCVAPIEHPPFYALRIYPADLGTAVGLRTDTDARVLNHNGMPIAGLYTCGNDMGSIMNGNYPGPGITLGPALTFGYIAGRHLAQTASGGARPAKGTSMSNAAAGFGVNTYSYVFGGHAADTVARLADQGYGGVELMFFPGHLWPAELDAAALRGLRDLCEQRLRLVSVNMPNVDMNLAAAAEEMRTYTLDLLVRFVRCAGELGAGGIIVGPGKPNPLFPMPRERMVSHFYRALDTLAPLAREVGTRLLIENMPFAFLPDAESLMNAVDGYGDDGIRVIYDVANAHFIGESPTDGLRRVRDRVSLVHFSDTTRQSYKHDPLGCGDVPLAGIPAVMQEIGCAELPMLEVISLDPDADIADSCRRLQQAGFGNNG